MQSCLAALLHPSVHYLQPQSLLPSLPRKDPRVILWVPVCPPECQRRFWQWDRGVSTSWFPSAWEAVGALIGWVVMNGKQSHALIGWAEKEEVAPHCDLLVCKGWKHQCPLFNWVEKTWKERHDLIGWLLRLGNYARL